MVLALFLAGWSLTSGGGAMRFVWAGLAVLTAVVLIIYGRAFLAKVLPGTEHEH